MAIHKKTGLRSEIIKTSGITKLLEVEKW